MEYGIVTVSEKKLFARIIQLFTWSKWNHVAFYFNHNSYKNIIIEMNSNGIQLFELEKYVKGKDVRIHKNTPKVDMRKILAFVFKNMHRKYDYWRTLFFFYKRKDINDYSKWNCIEFVEEMFKDQGIDLFNGEKLTPGQINKKLSSDEDLLFLRK